MGEGYAMNEADWMACTDISEMLQFVEDKCGGQVRLFACACCRQVWHTFATACQRAVEMGERFVDRKVNAAKLRVAEREAYEAASLHQRKHRSRCALHNTRQRMQHMRQPYAQTE